jgi:hypothetical protein
MIKYIVSMIQAVNSRQIFPLGITLLCENTDRNSPNRTSWTNSETGMEINTDIRLSRRNLKYVPLFLLSALFTENFGRPLIITQEARDAASAPLKMPAWAGTNGYGVLNPFMAGVNTTTPKYRIMSGRILKLKFSVMSIIFLFFRPQISIGGSGRDALNAEKESNRRHGSNS